MVLVDSSIFIEYYRLKGSPAIRTALKSAIDADLVTVNGMIQVEVLGYVPAQSNLSKLMQDFKDFHWLDLQEVDFDFATEIGFFMRRKAFTVPATDLIIAASAMRADIDLFHMDGHYDMLARHFDLKSRNLLTSQLN
jgi:predicted nucleic acid-binding protein